MSIRKTLTQWTAVCIFVLCAHSALAAPTLTYQGQLSGQNGAVNASLPMTFTLYTAPQNGNAVWTESHNGVAVVDGTFTAVLGETTSLANSASEDTLYLGITVGDGAEMTPRMKVGSAIRAQWAAHAQDVRGEDIHPSSVSIGDTEVINANGEWVGSASGIRGERGPAGERGPQGDVGPRGDTGTRGPSGPAGPEGIPGVAGVRGPQGVQGLQGEAGPVGPAGASFDVAQDSDTDGFVDWLEVIAGTEPTDESSVPADADEDGVPDILRGATGPAGAAGAAGPSGDDGASIDSVQVDDAGVLKIFMEDGRLITAGGRVAGPAGADGTNCTVAGDATGLTVSCTDGTSASVLNGTDGQNGTNGTDGINGTDGAAALVVTSAAPAGEDEDCVYGGSKLESGQDTNGDGALDFSEVLTTSFVCNGPQGADGQAGSGSGPLTDIFDENDSPRTLPMVIPKGSLLGTDAIIDLDYSGIITGVSVSVDIEHPDVSTLKLVLIAPDVDTYTLFDGPNGSSNGNNNANADLTTEFPAPTAAISDLAGLNGEPVAGRYILRAIDTDTSNTAGTRQIRGVTLKVIRQADDAWRLPSNLVIDGNITTGRASGAGGTSLLPVGEGAPKQCTGDSEGETFYDKTTHGMRVCDGEFWRATSGVCGNGLVEGGEECDSIDVGNATCLTSCILASTSCNGACDVQGAYGISSADLYQKMSTDYVHDMAMDGQFAVTSYTSANSSQGEVYVYQKRFGRWQKTQTLTASDKTDYDYFGYAVAISGTQMVVGARGNGDGGSEAGSAYIFEYNGSSWTQTAKLLTDNQLASNYFGRDVAIHNGVAVVSTTSNTSTAEAGKLFVFRKINGEWTQTQKFRPSSGGYFNCGQYKIGLSNEGLVALVNQSNTYKTIFFEDVNGQFVERKVFNALSSASRLAMSGNIAVESYQSTTQQARVYQLQNGEWTQTQTLTANDGANGDNFGGSVDVSGDLIIVGARYDDDAGSNSGSAYVFKRGNDGQFSQIRKLTAPDGAQNDYFGRHVGISGQSAAVFRDGNGYALDFFNGLETPEGSALCTQEGFCICKRGFGGADCATAL
jgi:hypothetical protein